MAEKLISLIKKNSSILVYFFCSGISAVLEYGLLFIFKNISVFESNIVYANILAVALSSVLHYIATSVFVFKVRIDYKSLLIYLVTFFMGLGIQSLVLWVTYEKLLCNIIINDNILTLVCKTCSLASSFFITYFVRKKLNNIIKKHEGEKSDE